ncbi:polyketide cyclase [Sphingopyxis lindanitolerans]|uniref:Polyketide cyclase n=1 Tax=Sphingopyxis lindanitolerans TaxID=2054227 RepID=A0A2S8B670_9SPHN|nr:SRPBCC family protein [Sphingopyxis lindanitolerans]PQM27816.1 polyketide cyclase [Sphingopyxis lindanitolerans]
MTTDTELTISRLIAAPPSAVWEAWSIPANLEKWWIPAPIACRVDTLDLRPGGGFVTRMREGDGDWQPHIDGCFLEAVPEQRLVFTTVLTEGWQPADPWLAVTAILTFEARDGGTLYSARVLHKNPEDSAKHDEMGFQEGWGTAIGQLAALIER